MQRRRFLAFGLAIDGDSLEGRCAGSFSTTGPLGAQDSRSRWKVAPAWAIDYILDPSYGRRLAVIEHGGQGRLSIAQAAARLVAGRAKQGLPSRVIDPAALARIANIVREHFAAEPNLKEDSRRTGRLDTHPCG